MRRRDTVNAAIVAFLVANATIAVRAQSPPTRIRLVDGQGQPVVGAMVGTDLQYDRNGKARFQSREGSESRTDERGEAMLPIGSGTGIYAVREDPVRPLVGVTTVTPAQVGKITQIVMSPACRVRMRVECPGFQELEEKYSVELGGPNWERTAVVQSVEDRRGWQLVAATSRTSDLEVLLPPGRYTIRVTGDDIQPVSRSVEIQSGHRVRSLGLIDVSPSLAAQQGRFRNFWHERKSIPQNPPEVGGAENRRMVAFRRPEWGPMLNHDALGLQDLTFSPDGKILATAHGYNDRAGEVKLWDARTGTLTAILTGPEGEDGVHRLAFAPDGQMLAGSIGSLHVFELPSSVILWDVAGRRVKHTLRGHEAAITAVAFALDGKTLASASGDRSVRFWDVVSGRETGRFGVDIDWPEAIAYAPDGQTLAVAYGETLKLWDIRARHSLATLEPHGFLVHSLAFSPDGRSLAASGIIVQPNPQVVRPIRQVPDGVVRLYDLESRPRRRRATLVPLRFEVGAGPMANIGKDSLCSVRFTPDGRRVLSSLVGAFAMWDAESGFELASFARNTDVSRAGLACSPDGRWLAVAGGMGPRVRLMAIPQPDLP